MEPVGQNIRSDAYRHVAERYLYWLLAWIAAAAIVAWFFKWWALVPGALALRSLAMCVICLSREDRLRRED
jgi:hypothetical protein